jgi:hypothetical protein
LEDSDKPASPASSVNTVNRWARLSSCAPLIIGNRLRIVLILVV